MRRMALQLIGTLLVTAGCASTSPDGEKLKDLHEASNLSLDLKIDANNYDPENPSDATLTIKMANMGSYPVKVVPFEANGNIKLQAVDHEWPLVLRSKTSKKMKDILVLPGSEAVLFQVPLTKILPVGKASEWKYSQTKKWNWTWSAHPAPPLSPIHEGLRRNDAYRKALTLKCVFSYNGRSVESKPVVLTIGKSTK